MYDTPRPLHRHPPFLMYWAARVLSGIGMQVAAVAVGWQVYDLTRSPLALGMVGLVQFLPMILLTLPAGHVVDRYDRRLVVVVSQGCAGIAAAALALGSSGGWLTLPLIYLATAVIGGARAFLSPSIAALLPGIVASEQFPRATALGSSAMQAATILGPAVGGLLYGLGPATPYGLAAACFLGTGLLTALIRLVRATASRNPPGLRELFAGIAFIRRQPIVLGSISLDLFAVLLGGATALLPVYADRILDVGPVGLGLLRSAPAVGALLMSALLAARPMRRQVGRRMFAAVAIFGLATIVFGLSTSLPVSLAALFVMGCADNVSVVIRTSLVQLATPDALRGRVGAVNFLFVGTSNQLGEFESGVLAALVGTVAAVVLGGLGTVAIALLWMRLFPALRELDAFGDLAASDQRVASSVRP